MSTSFESLDITSYIGAVLSGVLVAVLWTTWYLIPRWRTLNNYISVNQITTATLHLIASIPYFDYISKILLLRGILFQTSMCWSLAASIVAYLKLVLLHNSDLHNEKLNVTIFVYGLSALIKFVCYVIVRMYHINIEMLEFMLLSLFPLFLMVNIIIVLIIRVIVSVMSCCKRRMSKRNIIHVIALVGVAVLCDIGTILYFALLVFWDNDVMEYWFIFRLVPQAAYILFNTSSRAHWKWYYRRRSRMSYVV